MILRKNRDPRPGLYSVRHQPRADGFRHPPQLGVGVALDIFGRLDFNRDVLRPALCAFDKAVVEGGHELRKYTSKVISRGTQVRASRNIRAASNMLGF